MAKIIRNEVEFGGGDNAVEITQAEYDKLPPEQKKNNITYYITDSDPSSSGGGSSNVDVDGETIIKNEDGKLSVNMDDALNEESMNPVQNKVIVKELRNMREELKAKSIIKITTNDPYLFGKEVTATCSEETVVGTFSDSGEVRLEVHCIMEYIVVCEDREIHLNVTDMNTTYEESININGDTADPNDIQTWLKCGGINDKNYSTLSEVISDTTVLSNLMNDENAMKYLARSTDFATEGCADETFMTYLGQSPYLNDTVLNNDLWCEKICDSQYFEKVLNSKVPAMTSNTTPSGVVSSSSYVSGYTDWKAFAGYTDTGNSGVRYVWATQSAVPQWLMYKFTSPVVVKRFGYENFYDGYYHYPLKVELLGSSDGNTFVKLGTFDGSSGNNTKHTYFVMNNRPYLFYRINVVENYGSWVGFTNAQFYGRVQK